MRQVHIYIEGGGNDRDTRSTFRQAFRKFIKTIIDDFSGEVNIIPSGGRTSTYDRFLTSLRQNPDIINILIVDAEEIRNSDESYTDKELIWDYLKRRDFWDTPKGINERNAYVMVRTMETWLIADRENLKKFYGKDFNENAIPKNSNLENVTKDQIEDGLDRATMKTSKGKYSKNKGRDSFAILMTTDSEIVKNACLSCRRLFDELPVILQAG